MPSCIPNVEISYYQTVNVWNMPREQVAGIAPGDDLWRLYGRLSRAGPLGAISLAQLLPSGKQRAENPIHVGPGWSWRSGGVVFAQTGQLQKRNLIGKKIHQRSVLKDVLGCVVLR